MTTQSKEMRNRWHQCIKNELETSDTDINLEIVSIINSLSPLNQKFIIYAVSLDLDSYLIHLINESINNKSMLQKIKNEFYLDSLPQVSLTCDIEMENNSISTPKEEYQDNVPLSQQFLLNVDD